MSDAVPTVEPGWRRFGALCADALRGITRQQVRDTALLGLCFSVANMITFWGVLLRISTTMSILEHLVGIVVIDQLRAMALLAAVVIADRAVDLGAPRRRAYLVAALGGCLLGSLVGEPIHWASRTWLHDGSYPPQFTWLHGAAARIYFPLFNFTHWLLIGSAIVFLYADRRTARRTEARLQSAERNRIRSSKTALESRLQAMQARVEPQFLFNTLAQVERLYELDPSIAARMLDDLIAYLRAAMPLMRDTSSTVAQEVELARAYLDIVRLRLGDRLQVTIDVPPEAGGARMPPMMLLPLTDHAVTHGIEQRRGGMMQITIEMRAPRLVLRIVDSGAGFVPEVVANGIADIRARLAALFGPEAALTLQRRGATATEAILDLPLESHGGAGVAHPAPA